MILAVTLEDGSRVMGNFLPDETLEQILFKLCPREVKIEENPIVIYMRNEIFGENLQKKTLRSLGLRGGRAMMRLVHKSPEELKIQANVSAPLPSKPVIEKPFRPVLKVEAAPQETVVPTEEQHEPQVQVKAVQKKPEVDILKLAREKRKLESSPSKSVETQQIIPKTRQKVDILEPMEVDDNLEPANTPPEIEENFIFVN